MVRTLKPTPSSFLFHGVAYDEHTRIHPNETTQTNLGKLPKQNFPIYEGETTRLWVSQAKDYFDMYEVPPRQWVKISCMNFRGAAARWIESISQPDRIPWPNFCKMLHDRFGRDQRDKLVRQMFHISQTSTVIDYVESFSTLFDQLKAYQHNPDMHYFTTRFMDGLRDDIRMVVTLQRPSRLDTAYSLALLQEEVAASVLKTDNTRPGFRPYHKLAITMPKPNAADKPLPEKTSLKSSDDKLSTL